jgi:hypothetical protein
LTSSPLRLTRHFFQLNPCGNSPHVISSDDKIGMSVASVADCSEYAWPFVKCTFRTFSMVLKILPFAVHASPPSVQDLQSRSCTSYVSNVFLHFSHNAGSHEILFM